MRGTAKKNVFFLNQRYHTLYCYKLSIENHQNLKKKKIVYDKHEKVVYANDGRLW